MMKLLPSAHFPYLWKFRVLRGIGAGGRVENRRLLDAWAACEGGSARYNPLNTTEPWPGATDYNSAHVKNYASGSDGVRATVVTLLNGHYPGIVRDLRAGILSARLIAEHNAAEIQTWGTTPSCIISRL